MARSHVYLHGDDGDDANGGTSWADACKTLAAAAVLCAAEYTNEDGLTLHIGGIVDIDSGGDATDSLFEPGVTFADFTIEWEIGAWVVYGTVFSLIPPLDMGGYDTVELVLPSGVDLIEGVSVDFNMSDQTHYTSDGRRKLYLAPAANATACEATGDSFFHDGVDTLHYNVETVYAGYLTVRYRPSADVQIFKLAGRGIHFRGSGVASSGILYPMYKNGSISPYAIQILASTTNHEDYSFADLRFDGCWHSIGILDTSTSGSLAFDDIDIQRCEFNAEVIGDQAATLSYNPIVIYSGNTSGTIGTPVYIDITNWYLNQCVFNCYRPVFMDGTSFPNDEDIYGTATAGGTTGNNSAQLVFSHGGNAYALPRIFNQADRGGVSSKDCVVNLWDYEASDPYFAQPTHQSFTDANFSDSAWESFAVDLECRSHLAYNAAYNTLRYGLISFSSDRNIRIKRWTWEAPNCNVITGAASDAMLPIIGTGSSAVVFEIEESKIICSNSRATYAAFFRLQNSTGQTRFRARHMTMVQELATLAESIVWFDVSGASATAEIECYGCIFHSNDTVNTTYWVAIYDASTTQLPLYGTDPTALVMQNNWYSNVGASRYDVSGTDRDTATEWAANSGEGPHDGTLGNGAGRDARYSSAGTWDATTEEFTASSAARTSKIDTSVTLTYSPTTGANGRVFDRHFGADQYGGGAAGALVCVIDTL